MVAFGAPKPMTPLWMVMLSTLATGLGRRVRREDPVQCIACHGRDCTSPTSTCEELYTPDEEGPERDLAEALPAVFGPDNVRAEALANCYTLTFTTVDGGSGELRDCGPADVCKMFTKEVVASLNLTRVDCFECPKMAELCNEPHPPRAVTPALNEEGPDDDDDEQEVGTVTTVIARTTLSTVGGVKRSRAGKTGSGHWTWMVVGLGLFSNLPKTSTYSVVVD